MILDPAPLDEADPLGSIVDAFVPSGELDAYLDGNSLGRPLSATLDRLHDVVERDWGSRLIRSWDERWFDLPLRLGDRIASIALGSASGQTVVADSTTVLLYKLVRAAYDAATAADPLRTEIVLCVDDFPTDRFVLDGIARETGATLRWIPGADATADGPVGVTAEKLGPLLGDRTALVVLGHVDYRSGHLADLPGLTRLVHEAGALVLWDLCHSAGVIPMSLDDAGVDLAVGCTYKYLNGGPGAPAFAYVARELQPRLEQPIQGWMGAADVFAMAEGYRPAEGMRRFISGTPPILGMVPMQDMLDLLEGVGIEAVRAKSIELTEYALALVDDLLAPLGVQVASPRAAESRGGHVTVSHPSFRDVTATLWARDVIPDFRHPDGLRIGLSPLSTSFAEVHRGVLAVRDALVVLPG